MVNPSSTIKNNSDDEINEEPNKISLTRVNQQGNQ